MRKGTPELHWENLMTEHDSFVSGLHLSLFGIQMERQALFYPLAAPLHNRNDADRQLPGDRPYGKGRMCYSGGFMLFFLNLT